MTETDLSGLRTRLEGIQQILMAHWAAGSALPSAAKGAERETLMRDFLSTVFPAPFRFGSGAIVDPTGRSGQVDVVVEFPLLPSFPAPGTTERLYLIDSVALAVEVKSDLSKQWSEVRATCKRIQSLRRSWHAHASVDYEGKMGTHSAGISRAPFLAVGYKGPTTPAVLEKWRAESLEDERPDGILVIESGAYTGCWFNGWAARGTGPAGLLGFCLDVAWLARNVVWAAPDLKAYVAGMTTIED
jgi:hypothetical protein